MTEVTYELVKGYFLGGRELGETPVRGIAESVRLFTIDREQNRLFGNRQPRVEAIK